MLKKKTGVKAVTATPKFSNGDYVKDVVTKLEGVITASTIWLNGCIRYVVQPQEIKDGKPVESSVFDEQQLELIAPAISEDIAPKRLTGGNRDDRKATSRA